MASIVSCDLTTTTDDPPATTLSPSAVLGDQIWIYMGPIIVFVGITGNILILVVMGQKRMRGTSTSEYLIIMAVADILSILMGIVPGWLSAMDIVDLQNYSPAGCQLVKFLNYTTSDVSTWIRVLFTLDRFMAICFPLKKTDCCLPWRAKYYCLLKVLTAIAFNMRVFWTRGAEYTSVPVYEEIDCVPVKTNRTETVLKSNCGNPTEAYAAFESYVSPWLTFLLVNLIPFCVILVCNVFIIRAMVRMRRMGPSKVHGRESVLLQTAAMCLIASFTCLVFMTPTMVLLIGKPYWTTEPNPAYDIAKSISNGIIYINYGINFFLYCLTGKRFRQTLVDVMRCRGGLRRTPGSSFSEMPSEGRQQKHSSGAGMGQTGGQPRRSTKEGTSQAAPDSATSTSVSTDAIEKKTSKVSWIDLSQPENEITAEKNTGVNKVEETLVADKEEKDGTSVTTIDTRMDTGSTSSGVSSDRSDSVEDPSSGHALTTSTAGYDLADST